MLVVVTVTVNDGAAFAAEGHKAVNVMSAKAKVSKIRSRGRMGGISFPGVMTNYPDDA